MLKAATITMSVSTRNITFVCATTAEKNPALAWNQSNTQPSVPTASMSRRRVCTSDALSDTKTSMPVTFGPRLSRR